MSDDLIFTVACRNSDLALLFIAVFRPRVASTSAYSSLEDLLCRKEEEVLAALGRMDTLKQRLQVRSVAAVAD